MKQVRYKELFLRDVTSGKSEATIKRPSVTPMEVTLWKGQEGDYTGIIMFEERQKYQDEAKPVWDLNTLA